MELFVKNSLQKEINLSDNELYLIVFTSLDHDFLPHLILLQGEFLKWFQLNFEGENNDETDFLENKLEQWQSTTSLSSDILNLTKSTSKMQSKGITDLEIIMQPKWWNVFRY